MDGGAREWLKPVPGRRPMEELMEGGARWEPWWRQRDEGSWGMTDQGGAEGAWSQSGADGLTGRGGVHGLQAWGGAMGSTHQGGDGDLDAMKETWSWPTKKTWSWPTKEIWSWVGPAAETGLENGLVSGNPDVHTRSNRLQGREDLLHNVQLHQHSLKGWQPIPAHTPGQTWQALVLCPWR